MGICAHNFWIITMEGREKHSEQCGGGEGHCSNLYSIWGQCGGSSGIYKYRCNTPMVHIYFIGKHQK